MSRTDNTNLVDLVLQVSHRFTTTRWHLVSSVCVCILVSECAVWTTCNCTRISCVSLFCLQFQFNKARQRIDETPTCVYDTEPKTKRTALHFLCYFSNWKSPRYSDRSIDEYYDVSEYSGDHDFREYNKYHGHDLKKNFLKRDQSLFKIMGLAQLILETSHMLLQKPEVVSQYTSHSIQNSILVCKDYDGDTPLHTLFEYWNVNVNMLALLFDSCQKNTSLQDSKIPHVIELILHKNDNEETTLHSASQCICSFSAWKYLLEQFPVEKDNSMLQVRDCNGQTPLHHAFDYGISIRRLELYLNTFSKEELYIQDKDDETPLNATFNCRHKFPTAQSMWSRVVMIMNVILKQDKPTRPMFALATLSDMIPRHWLELGLQFHQDGLDDMDHQGRSPLHVAGMCPSREMGDAHFLRLLQEHPAVARQHCHQGRLPLHYVLETGKSVDCVQALVLEYPNALNESDPVSGLPCFLLAMVVKDSSLPCSENRLSNCYFLLQDNPAMIHMLSSGY